MVATSNTFNVVPEELKALHQWVVWRAEERKGKTTKVPYMPIVSPLHHASTTNPQTWGSFQDAVYCYDIWYRDYGTEGGIGFVFTEDDPYVGIDLDHCVDEDGEYSPLAHDVLDIFSDMAYIELSPSGMGVHLITRAKLPGGGKGVRQEGLEVYGQGRFFTVTGNTAWSSIFSGMALPDQQEAFDRFYAKYIDTEPPKPAAISPQDATGAAGMPERWQDIQVTLDPNARPPIDKFDELMKEERFRRTWEHKRAVGRPVGGLKDGSASTYDFAVAVAAYRSGWTLQEITDLLIYHRVRYGYDKIDRMDYYQRTLFNLIQKVEVESARALLDESDHLTTEDRGLIVDTIRTLTGIHVSRYIQYGRSPASYGVGIVHRGDDYYVGIGSSEKARNQTTWQNIAQEYIGAPFETLDRRRWQSFLHMLGQIREFEDMPETQETSEVGEALRLYARNASIVDKPDPDMLHDQQAYIQDGVLYFPKSGFTSWLGFTRSSVSQTGIISQMRGAGASRVRVYARSDTGERTQRDYWRFSLNSGSDE